jgi:DNA-binding NtrC family response regulator
MTAAGPNAVLVIDPDPSTRALIVALLRREGYVAVAAASPDEALRLHRDRRHAAVILDPRVHDGDALLHALQSADDGAAPSSKLIVVTTREHSTAIYDGRPGVHTVLFKPFVLNDLAEAVASCCDGAS